MLRPSNIKRPSVRANNSFLDSRHKPHHLGFQNCQLTFLYNPVYPFAALLSN
jgi:hypothetical protein